MFRLYTDGESLTIIPQTNYFYFIFAILVYSVKLPRQIVQNYWLRHYVFLVYADDALLAVRLPTWLNMPLELSTTIEFADFPNAAHGALGSVMSNMRVIPRFRTGITP